jgi:oligopeptidase A
MAVVKHWEFVANSPELREAVQTIDPEVSEFSSSIPLNEKLWKAIQAVPFEGLSAIEERYLTKQIDAFRRHGAELDADGKRRVMEIDIELQKLCTKFSQNVLDATNAFELMIEDESRLEGLPDSAKAMARANAESKGKPGYRFTLQAPSMTPVLTYASDRELRHTLWQAYNARAVDGEFDNRDLMRQILTLRREKARLLGYFNFADFVLADRMAKRGSIAREFVADLEKATREKFIEEHAALEKFAGVPLEPWDVGYYAEKQRQALYDFDEEVLRPYFPADAVIDGMYRLFGQLLGIEVRHRADAKVYEPSVKYFEIYGGAWMEGMRTGGPRPDGSFLPHLGAICGNMTPPLPGKPALLTHRDVETIFHEFGHLLHHCLSEVPLRGLSGTNVPWDFVELPSQIMENWCWERESLDFFAAHHETGAKIPEELLQKMRRARTYRAASMQMRQVGFGTVDLELHTNFDPQIEQDLLQTVNQMLQRFSPLPLPPNYGMILGFTHLFAGPVAYAAGYYSYKWAEVLDADAFSRFQESGVLDHEVGQHYRRAILAKGNSEDPQILYRAFMGRDASPDALMRRNGLAS